MYFVFVHSTCLTDLCWNPGFQLGGRLAGFNTHALEELKKERGFSAASMTKAANLEKSLDLERSAREVLESGMATKIKEAEARKEAELSQKIKDADARAVKAEGKVSGLEKEVADLKKLLEEWEEPEKVIAEFQESKAYEDALAKAAAAKVVRCWHLAERHIKSDPVANLQSFIELYLAAKDKIKAGEGEPEPYDGLSPNFLPPTTPDSPVDERQPEDSPAN